MGWWKQREIWEGRGPTGVAYIIIVKQLDEPNPGHHSWRVEYGQTAATKRDSTIHHTSAEASEQAQAIRDSLVFDWVQVWPDRSKMSDTKPTGA